MIRRQPTTVSGGVTRIFKSRLFLVLLFILLTHYATVYYYMTRSAFSSTTVSVQVSETIELPTVKPNAKGIYTLRDSILIKFPTNLIYEQRASNPDSDKGMVEQPKVKQDFNDESSLYRNDTKVLHPYGSPAKSSSSQRKLILAWTRLTQKKPLWGIKASSFSSCEFKNCMITGTRSKLSDADLLLFRVRELKPLDNGRTHRPYVKQLDFSDMPEYHPANQIWIDVNQV